MTHNRVNEIGILHLIEIKNSETFKLFFFGFPLISLLVSSNVLLKKNFYAFNNFVNSHYVTQVLGDFDSTHYVTDRQWAPALDGTLIPISIVYRKDLVKLDGSDPLLLYGYGSYEVKREENTLRIKLQIAMTTLNTLHFIVGDNCMKVAAFCILIFTLVF